MKTSNGVTLNRNDELYTVLLVRATLSVIPLSWVDSAGAYFGFTPLTTIFGGLPVVYHLQISFSKMAIEMIILSWIAFLSIAFLTCLWISNSDTDLQISERQRAKSIISILALELLFASSRYSSIEWMKDMDPSHQAHLTKESFFFICFMPFSSAFVAFLAGLAIRIARG